MLVTVVEGDPKVPFLIACVAEGATPFPGLFYFTLDLYLIVLIAKQGGIKYHFWVFGMTRLGIEPRSPGPLANNLPMAGTSILCVGAVKGKMCNYSTHS